MFTRVQRGEECSSIKDIILCFLSHQFFLFLHATQSVRGKVFSVARGEQQFGFRNVHEHDLVVTCLHSSLSTLSPQVPIRHLASDTPAFRGLLSCTVIFLALGFQAGLLASSISLSKVSEHVACNYPAKESSVTPHCPEGEVGALPWLLGPLGLALCGIPHVPSPAVNLSLQTFASSISTVAHITYYPNQDCSDHEGGHCS